MSKALTLKVFEIDYSFIIKNYLDENLWQKEWTVFIYKGFQVTIRLSSINVQDRIIFFQVQIHDTNEENKSYWNKTVSMSVSYYMQQENIDILKKCINNTIYNLIQRLEEIAYIQMTDEYKKTEQLEETERERLRDIAEEFLDGENVTNEEIREAYIEYYIDQNEEVYSFSDKLVGQMRYTLLTDFYFIFLKAIKDEGKLIFLERELGKKKTKEVLEEIKEYMETEEFEEDLKGKLDEI